MDRRVKERLIGASILVLLLVLVVPELLSGPKPAIPTPPLPALAPEAMRHITVDLANRPTPAETDAQAASAAPASAAVPLTAPMQTLMPMPAAPPPSRAAEPVNPPADPVETPPVSPISTSRGSFAVQLGSFASRSNADNLTHQLRTQGFMVYVLTGGSGQAVRYRVRVGPLPNRAAADRVVAKLKSTGHESSIVAPAP